MVKEGGRTRGGNDRRRGKDEGCGKVVVRSLLCLLSFQLLFAHATESRLYYTLNEGDSFHITEITSVDINPRTINYHPDQDGWMMAVDSSIAVSSNTMHFTPTDYINSHTHACVYRASQYTQVRVQTKALGHFIIVYTVHVYYL